MLFRWFSSRSTIVLFAVIYSQLLSALCDEDDELSEKMVQDLMREQRKRDKQMALASNGTETTTQGSHIVKSRGELTVDLLKYHLIADFIFDVPFIVCTVEWVEGNFANLGNFIPLNVVDYQPYWLDWKGNKSEWYTFIMSGLDEPSENKPSLREYQHWVLVNIPGDKFREGETLVSYKVPAPEKGTGRHRHGIVVYKQPGKLTFDEKPIKSLYDDKLRGNFSNIKFAEKYNFGEPVAINFFRTEWAPPPTIPSSLPASLFTRPTYFTTSAPTTVKFNAAAKNQRVKHTTPKATPLSKDKVMDDLRKMYAKNTTNFVNVV